MLNKTKKQRQSAWSRDMLELVRERLMVPVSPGHIYYEIKERTTSLSFNKNTQNEDISYRGRMIYYKGLEDVYMTLNSFECPAGEYQDHMGYIEIVNGVADMVEEVSVPMIRGFIKKDTVFFESVNKMLIESRIFNVKQLIALEILVDVWNLNDIHAEKILNMKLPIKSVAMHKQRVFFA